MIEITVSECPVCRMPITYGQERIAAREHGRVREYHAECRGRPRTTGPVAPVGRRLEEIFGERDGR